MSSPSVLKRSVNARDERRASEPMRFARVAIVAPGITGTFGDTGSTA